jgi:predicted DCC family thiol-disulfide oxidoreductase YuxK
MTPALYAACARAVHVIKRDGTVLRGGRACLFVLESLGWKSARLLTIPPLIWGVELGYRIAARNRGIIGRLLGHGR